MPNTKATLKMPPKLTKTEEDLLWHLEHGYQLESGPVGSGPVLRRLKDNSVVRTASANQSTIKALEERRLIKTTQSRDKLTTIWRAAMAPQKRHGKRPASQWPFP
jgi:hypothetical protein